VSRSASNAIPSRTNILLVDEELADLFFLESILADLGQNLVRVRSGSEALSKLFESDFAVILLAVQMSGMDGFQTAKQIRRRPESSHIPIIFLTESHSREFPIFDAYKLGAVDYLAKPFVPEVLRGKVRALVEIHQKTEQVRHQTEQLRQMEKGAFEQKLREQQQQWEMERLRQEALANKKIAEALREADRRKDEFLAMLAHELRNPLAPVLNGLHVIKQLEKSDTTIARVREIMERQVQNLARLVDDLLDVARITHGKINLRKGLVDVATVVKKSVETHSSQIEGRRQQLEISLPVDPAYLEADPARLEQVLTNLLNNASKYTPEGGRIQLTAGKEGNQIVICVKDTGIGIPVEMLPTIFEPFQQWSTAAGQSQGGLGIGLNLVRQLVELHGGTVRASSAGPGLGSEFVVRLPAVSEKLKREAGGTRDSGSRSISATAKRRILVVDDNKDAAKSLAMVLRLDGHEVRVAHSGLAALAIAEAEQPEVIVLDIGMPGLDGYEVAQRLRQRPGAEGVLLVALTGFGQEDDRRRSQEAGFDCHLVKPVAPDDLKRLLDHRKLAGRSSQ
jgi:signal transduction histidine kinase